MISRDDAPTMIDVFDGNQWRRLYLQHGQPQHREWEHKAVYRPSKADQELHGESNIVVLIGVKDE